MVRTTICAIFSRRALAELGHRVPLLIVCTTRPYPVEVACPSVRRQAGRCQRLARSSRRRGHCRIVAATLDQALLPAETADVAGSARATQPALVLAVSAHFERVSGARRPAGELAGIVAARIDLLKADERSLSRSCGDRRVFWPWAIGPPRRSWRRSRARSSFAASGSSIAASPVRVRHALVRDVAVPRCRSGRGGAAPAGRPECNRVAGPADGAVDRVRVLRHYARPSSSARRGSSTRARYSTGALAYATRATVRLSLICDACGAAVLYRVALDCGRATMQGGRRCCLLAPRRHILVGGDPVADAEAALAQLGPIPQGEMMLARACRLVGRASKR